MISCDKKNTFKVSKTCGFYLIECYFKKYHNWPTDDGVRGFGGIILALINFIWALYPTIMEVSYYKITFNECLFRSQFLIIALGFLTMNVLFLYHSDNLFALIKVLSDFNNFGYPKRMEFLEKINRRGLKIANCIAFLVVFLISYGVFFDKKFCSDLKWFANEKSITCDLMIAYYIPFNLKPWIEAVMVLFQMFSFIAVFKIILGMVLLYTYILELLILRLEHLTLSINNIRFKRNQTDVSKLKTVIENYQNIYKLFQMANNFIRYIIVAPKFGIIICIILSATGFLLRPNLGNFIVASMSCLVLYYVHYTAQKLIDAGNNVTEAIYSLNWYDADLRTQKDVLIFLKISQKLLIMEVPLLGSLSHLQSGNEFRKIYVWINWISKISKNQRFD